MDFRCNMLVHNELENPVFLRTDLEPRELHCFAATHRSGRHAETIQQATTYVRLLHFRQAVPRTALICSTNINPQRGVSGQEKTKYGAPKNRDQAS